MGDPRSSVFISYSHKDRDLVLGEIKPLLDAAELRVVLDRDSFLIGGIPSANMEKAARESDFTLAVITASYSEGEWTKLESLTALALKKLVPIVFSGAERIDSRIRENASYAEFRHPAEWDQCFRKMLEAFGLSVEAIAEAFLRRGPRDTAALQYWMRHPTTEEVVQKWDRLRAAAAPSMQRLMSNKELHDVFQTAQLSYRPAVEAKAAYIEARGTGLDPAANEALRLSVKAKCKALRAQLREVLRQAGDERGEAGWVGRLKIGMEVLEKGEGGSDLEAVEALKTGLEGIGSEIWKEPTYLNQMIVGDLRALNLPSLTEPLVGLGAVLRAANFREDAQTRVDSFTSKLSGLEAVGVGLKRLVHNHERLQEIDDWLAQIDTREEVAVDGYAGLFRDVGKLKSLVPYLRKFLRDVAQLESRELPEEIDPLKEAAEALKAAIDAESSPAKTLATLFSSFREAVTNAFHPTDHALKRLSGQLNRDGDTLAASLLALRNGATPTSR